MGLGSSADRVCYTVYFTLSQPSTADLFNNNNNKTKALVFRRSRTVNPSHGDIVLTMVSICASPNIDILA